MQELSYVSGTSDAPLHYLTVGAALDRAAKMWPDREALVVCHQGIRWTWSELRREAQRCAAAMLGLGLKPGDRVSIWAPNRSEWIVAQFGSAYAGLILVNINPAYRVAELEYALNKVGCRLLMMSAAFKSSDYLAMVQELAPEIARGSAETELHSARLPHLRHVVVLDNCVQAGVLNFAPWLGRISEEAVQGVHALQAQLQPEDPINIQFTSGTTGSPKGATLSHHSIVNNGWLVGRGQRFSEVDRLCIPVPLYHCFGMVMGVLNCVMHGATMIFPSESFDPLAVLRAVEQERCTALYGVPTMFIAELDHPQFAKFDLSSLRTGVMAGSPCPVAVMQRVVESMHMAEVTIGYGMTETSPVSFQTCPTDPLDKRVGSVGRVHPHLEVKLVDELGRVVPRGAPGELCTRGYSVMHGYWGDADRTREAVDAHGWMHTGDLAVFDEQGYCNIVGRLKDLIIRGGENIYPREIEEFLYRHPDIQEVAVFGVPDPRFGEAVAVWICLRKGASAAPESIQDYCRGQIAHYKIPQYVRFVDELPMTVTGKIQKFVMREVMMRDLQLSESTTA